MTSTPALRDDPVAFILALYRDHGATRYESSQDVGVTQLEHALQSGTLAQRSGAPDTLIAAAFLHDVGHLLWAGDEHLRGVDDRHETCALPLLRRAFPPTVLEPIRLHVAAKRYLCSVEPSYHDDLSVTSQRTLALQGGRFTAAEAAAFRAQPGADEAVLLRRWDDGAKVVGADTLSIDYFAALLASVRSDAATA